MKVVFLDRDGVINESPGDDSYVNNPEEFKFIPGSIEGIRKFNEYGFYLAVISNQSGVAKGLYSQEDLKKISEFMLIRLKEKNACLSNIYYCTHRDEDDCSCRKPKSGLLEKAVSDLGAVPEVSFFIGDSFSDMLAARVFGAKSVLVLSGKETLINRKNWAFEPDYVFANLLEAASYICSHYG